MKISKRVQQKRSKLAAAALIHVPFDGWSNRALEAGASDLNLMKGEVACIFPDGASDFLSFAAAQGDEAMLASLKKTDLKPLKIRDRIALAVRTRIQYDIPHREAVIRATTYLALPHNQPLAAKALYATIDAMWRGIGDTSVDFNFYSKRALLAGVYSSTILFWLQDTSNNYGDTWAFLDRRIEDVLGIQKLRGHIKDIAKCIPVVRRFI